MKRTRTTYVCCFGAALGLSVALVNAGCGDDENSTSTTTASSTTGGSTDSSSSTSGAGGAGGAAGTGGASSSTTSASSSSGNPQASLSFFVSSTGSTTGNLGGLMGADKRCQDLAAAVGAGDKTWHAYLSVEDGGNGQPVNAKDRIGAGPWFNAKMVMVAADVADLHTKLGDYTIFIDENGKSINGQWAGSPMPNEHDILTGSKLDGTVMPGETCKDWTSEDAADFGWVGHSDGLGPNMSMDAMYRPWNSVHENGGCNNTAPKGGAGRIYCFAVN